MQLRSKMNHGLVVLCELCVSKGIEPDGNGKGVCGEGEGVSRRMQSHLSNVHVFLQELQNCKDQFNNA